MDNKRFVISYENEPKLTIDNVVMKKGDKFSYDTGDNRGTLCEFIDFYYGSIYDKNYNITGYSLNAIMARRYYDDEKRWSTGKIRIDNAFFNFISLIN